MHDEVKRTFREAIIRSLPFAQQFVSRSVEPHLVWRKSGDRQWRGEYEQRPSLAAAFTEARNAFEEIGAAFLDAFVRHHPEYGGMVGFPSFARMRVLHDPSYIVGCALATLCERHGSLDIGPDAVEAIVMEFCDFIDRATVPFQFQTQLLNFQTPVESIELPAELRIRRLSEQELSDIYGGSVFQPRYTPHHFRMNEFVIEGKHEEPKIFGDQEDDSLVEKQVRPRLDRAILALRTFKDGRVGYDQIQFKAVTFCPLPPGKRMYGNVYVPFGNYEVLNEEIEPLRQHTCQIFALSEPSMEMACSRLSDAHTRLRPQDQLVDAVIGLEALLLAGLRGEDRRGELRYRFSLNYSTLFGTPEERHRAFRVAKDLYDLRSTIAHGGILNKDGLRIGDKSFTIDGAAKCACEVLRGVVNHFLPRTGAASYKDPLFWERGYFGLTSES